MVLGDSTAQAIGASGIERGYVGQVAAALERHHGRSWRVVNLSRTGARAADVVAEQLHGLARLGVADLVSCAVGSNDLLRRDTAVLDALGTIAAALPEGSLLANLPRGVRERAAGPLNAAIERLVVAHRLRLVDLWSNTGPPWRDKFSADWFHPNDRGYADWATSFCRALGIEGSP